MSVILGLDNGSKASLKIQSPATKLSLPPLSLIHEKHRINHKVPLKAPKIKNGDRGWISVHCLTNIVSKIIGNVLFFQRSEG